MPESLVVHASVYLCVSTPVSLAAFAFLKGGVEGETVSEGSGGVYSSFRPPFQHKKSVAIFSFVLHP